MRELDITAKQNLKDDLIAAYDDIFNMIIADYTDYHDDDDTFTRHSIFNTGIPHRAN